MGNKWLNSESVATNGLGVLLREYKDFQVAKEDYY